MKLNNKSAATLVVACGLSLMVVLPETAMAREDANTTESNTPANAEVVDTVSPLDEAQANLDAANKVVELCKENAKVNVTWNFQEYSQNCSRLSSVIRENQEKLDNSRKNFIIAMLLYIIAMILFQGVNFCG